MNSPSRTSLAVLVAAVLGGGVVAAADRPDDSPFAPAGAGAPAPTAAATPLDRYEFRGVMTLGLETFVTLVDTSNSKSITVTLGQEVDGIRVTEFHRESGGGRFCLRIRNVVTNHDPASVVVEIPGGATRMLPLRESTVVVAAPVAITAPDRVFSVAPGRMTPDDVAREIRDRREKRRQLLEPRMKAGASAPAGR